MLTRLQVQKNNLDCVRQERLSIDNATIEVPFQVRCDFLFKLNEAKLSYLKQYHGKQFETLFQTMHHATNSRYKEEIRYMYHPTLQNQKRLKCVEKKQEQAMSRFLV